MFNERRTTFAAYRKGNKISVTSNTPAHNLRIVNRIKLANKTCRVKTSVKRGQGDAVTVTFTGYLARRCRKRGFTMVVTDPANTMYSAINKIWRKDLKGRIDTQFVVGATPPNARLVHVHYSKTLAELLPTVVKDSNNVMALSLIHI